MPVLNPKETQDFLNFLSRLKDMDDSDDRKKNGPESPSDFKHPGALFGEAKITGLEANIHHLKGFISAMQERIVDDVKKLRASERDATKMLKSATRQRGVNRNLEAHLQRQAAINKDRLANKDRKLDAFRKTLEAQGRKIKEQTAELAFANAALAEIKSCLDGVLKQEGTSVEAMKAGFEKIMAVMTQPPAPAEAPAEKTPAEKAKEEPGCAGEQ